MQPNRPPGDTNAPDDAIESHQSRRSALHHMCKLLRICQQRGAYCLEEASHLHAAVVHIEKQLEGDVKWMWLDSVSSISSSNTSETENCVSPRGPPADGLQQNGLSAAHEANPVIGVADVNHIHRLLQMCHLAQSKGALTLYEAWTTYNAMLIFSNTTPQFPASGPPPCSLKSSHRTL